ARYLLNLRSFPTRRSSDLQVKHGICLTSTWYARYKSVLFKQLYRKCYIIPHGTNAQGNDFMNFTGILVNCQFFGKWGRISFFLRSEEHTSELQSRFDLVCR